MVPTSIEEAIATSWILRKAAQDDDIAQYMKTAARTEDFSEDKSRLLYLFSANRRQGIAHALETLTHLGAFIASSNTSADALEALDEESIEALRGGARELEIIASVES